MRLSSIGRNIYAKAQKLVSREAAPVQKQVKKVLAELPEGVRGPGEYIGGANGRYVFKSTCGANPIVTCKDRNNNLIQETDIFTDCYNRIITTTRKPTKNGRIQTSITRKEKGGYGITCDRSEFGPDRNFQLHSHVNPNKKRSGYLKYTTGEGRDFRSATFYFDKKNNIFCLTSPDIYGKTEAAKKLDNALGKAIRDIDNDYYLYSKEVYYPVSNAKSRINPEKMLNGLSEAKPYRLDVDFAKNRGADSRLWKGYTIRLNK